MSITMAILWVSFGLICGGIVTILKYTWKDNNDRR